MSLRLISTFLWKHGRNFLRVRASKGFSRSVTIHSKINEARLSLCPLGVPTIQTHFENARRIFAKSILTRVTNSLSAELRRKTTRQLLYGNSTPFFAFVGVSLASGAGIITKEDEFEGLCWEIREAISRMQKSVSDAESDVFKPHETIDLSKFTVGPMLAKGSNAVVYAARKSEKTAEETASGSEGPTLKVESDQPPSSYPFALKMMFNYDAESNAGSILRSMFCETVPAKVIFTNEELDIWQDRIFQDGIQLPSHPNVVAMHCVFADFIPQLPGSLSDYPDALPSRLNPSGSGRNMSLFLLMKRYDISLQEYIRNRQLSVRESILLLTQLLEAVAHLNSHSVAHRDLKSDNCLLDLSVYADDEGEVSPTLVVTDFGCCLADRRNGLSLPYRSHDTNKGGNAALMAPEVVLAEPGLFSSINYEKSDAWTVGAIAYELFNGQNPFYRSEKNPKPLTSRKYTEDQLPPLNEEVPEIIRRLVRALLSKNPSKRPTADFAATVCHLYLWAPSKWLNFFLSQPLPNSNEILQWLLCLTTKVLCTKTTAPMGRRRTATEYQMIASFLRRVRLSTIRSALSWIQQR